jgi:ATP-dependent DNA ligase
MTTYDILEKLRSDNSRLFKISVLEDEKDNTELKRVLTLALDPYTQFYQRKIPKYLTMGIAESSVISKEYRSLDWGLNRLNVLSSREKTGNAAIEFLKDTLSSLSEKNAKILECVIKKDLKCGISAKTVNKVFGKNFIFEYPCMLASAHKAFEDNAIVYPAIVQLKLDGMRANIICDVNGNVSLRSRSGRTIEVHGKFDELTRAILSKSPTVEDLDMFRAGVIDGELVVLDEDMETILDRKTGNGILNKAVRGTITQEEAFRIRMYCWDFIPLEDFQNGKSDRTYNSRLGTLKARLEDVYENWDMDYELIQLVQTQTVEDDLEVVELFAHALDMGEEGIMVKNMNSIWENKRSKEQLKFKQELDIDLIITEWKEGSGRLEGKMGSVLAETSDGLLEVSIGSGFNDADRELTPEDVVGKIITVKYNEVIRDKNRDKASLFLPIYQELRQDKFTADKMPT